MNTRALIIFLLTLLRAEGAETPKTRAQDLKPLASDQGVGAVHEPFAKGECQLCHQNRDAKNPGPVITQGNALCLDCHAEFQREVMTRKFGHVAATEQCVSCHNPHNSKETKLLVEYSTSLCLNCHEQTKRLLAEASLKHGAVTLGKQCVSCHQPHAANVQHLLHQPPKQLCLSCHDKSNVTDHRGQKLTNFKKLLEQNPREHAPVESGECSSCHNPHAAARPGLLTKDYPSELYARFAPQAYALCFECHEEKAFTEAETESATQFRDGRRNLHFLHVNREGLGRACHTCHEVHASALPHQMRVSVPYGSAGWQLKINFAKTQDGGSCAKTCHPTQSYGRSGPPSRVEARP